MKKKLKKYYLGGPNVSLDLSSEDSQYLINKAARDARVVRKEGDQEAVVPFVKNKLDTSFSDEKTLPKNNNNSDPGFGLASNILKGLNFGIGALAGVVNDANNIKQERQKYLSTLQQVQDPSFVQNDLPIYTKFGGGFPREAAFKILRDKKVNGKPLTDKQRKFFATMAFAKKKAQEGGPVEPKSSTPKERENWNMFVKYLRDNKIAGSKDLDIKDQSLGMSYLNKYNELNPDKAVSPDFIKTAQQEAALLKQGIFPEINEDLGFTLVNFKGRELSPVDGWLGSITTSQISYPTIQKRDSEGFSRDFGYDYSAYKKFLSEKATAKLEMGGDVEIMQNGGIPEMYKDKGFTKVGQKKESTRPGKKWMVLAKKGDKYKIVHGGDSKMKDFSQHGSEKRKDNFWNRMGGANSAKAKDPFSPLYWHKRFGTWQEGGEVPEVEGLPEEMHDQAWIEAEAGEVYKQPDGQVLKIDEDGDRHEDGGEFINNVEKVLEDTSTTRKDKMSKSLVVTPSDMEEMFGLVVNKNLSHSEAMEVVSKELDKKTSKVESKLRKTLKALEESPSSKYTNNSLEMNVQELQKYPTKENLFDTLFEHQESLKGQQDMKKAKYGINMKKAKYGDLDITLGKADKSGGATPTGKNNQEFNFTQEDFNRYAKRLGLRNDTNKNFQEDLYKYAMRNNPGAVKSMWELYGNTATGNKNKFNTSIEAFADGDPKARTSYLLGQLLKSSSNEETISTPRNAKYSPVERNVPKMTELEPSLEGQEEGQQTKVSSDMFDAPLYATDLLAPALSFLSADRIPANYNPASFKKVDPRLENVLPYLQQGQRDFNAITSKIDSNGSEVANSVNAFAQKYAVDTNTMATVADRNLQRQSGADAYNAQVSDKQSVADQQARAVFEQQQLLGMEAQRKQKLTALDEIFQRVNLNRKLNREGDLLMKLFPNFNAQGDYNGVQRYLTSSASTSGGVKNTGINAKAQEERMRQLGIFLGQMKPADRQRLLQEYGRNDRVDNRPSKNNQ